ncbi:MAG: hypothetical protein ACI8TX_000590 [Hyphomicrobiaceae bacterium]|jgi:hypothetical protein
MATMTAQEIERLGRSLANDLLTSAPPLVKGPANQVADIIIQTIATNFAAETSIEREAQATLRAMGRQAEGLDHEVLLAGIRKQLAKKHGFTS